MIEIWESFKEDLKEQAREWPMVTYVGKDGRRVEDYPKIPMTFEGFERYCRKIGVGYVHQYFDNKDDLYNDFVGICSCIKKEIRENQIIGGMLGMFNPSITQRLNNLAEKTDSTITTSEPRIFKID